MALGDPIERFGHFGPYKVVRQIGSGGMGSIFEAVHGRLGHRVAVKRLHPHVAARPGATERFLREACAAARIRHPHVVQVFAHDEETAGPYLAMELLDGCDLAARLAQAGLLGLDEALELLLPVIAAVAAAHDAGVIHRDLKPSNIFISRSRAGRPWPKVVDFGVSKVLGDDGAAASTATDAVVGTAAYMAPEHARSGREASFQSDQYSLAVVLYQCLTGKVPFSGVSEYELVRAIMTAPVAAPSEQVSSLPALVDPVVLRALHRNPSERFPSVRAFGAALLPFAGERDRLAWSDELGGESATPRPSTPVEAGEAPAAAEMPTHASMPPTARNTRPRAPRVRIVDRRWMGLVGFGAVAAGLAVWMGWAPHVESAPAIADLPQRERGAPTAAVTETVTESRPDPKEGYVPEPTATAVADASAAPPQVRSPLVVAASRPRRPAPGASASAAQPARPPVPAVGENGAPILP
jgi:serine/threonine-protein kinase